MEKSGGIANNLREKGKKHSVGRFSKEYGRERATSGTEVKRKTIKTKRKKKKRDRLGERSPNRERGRHHSFLENGRRGKESLAWN